jgi:hypothetical protein
MTDEVKTAVADVKSDVAAVAAEPAKVEAAVVATEAKTVAWVEKHPNVTAVIAVVVGVALVYAIFHML